ncbi:MAG: tetratricopeptide repeat protein, partial [Candidatus Omnitrophica bacterium]|nr:tetratricopeptide repeat protein [Candidatus Omnitrophota bacterium]
MKKIKILFSILIILQLNLFTFSSVFSQEKKIDPTIEKGIGQYKHENYDEALITLKKARSEDPKSTLAAYYLGLTYKQLQDYNEAIVHLKDAVTFSPKIKGALIELIDCYYQIGELDEAKIWIREAEKEGIRPAQTAFLKGLILLKGAEEEKAITAFGKAKSLDKSMIPACDYQIGICNLRARKYVDARKAFEQVAVVDPSSNMA